MATESGALFWHVMYCSVSNQHLCMYAAFAVALCVVCSYLCSLSVECCATWHIQYVCTVCSAVPHIGR